MMPWNSIINSIFFFFFNDTATTEIYTLSLHDALPICAAARARARQPDPDEPRHRPRRSEEHTSELQSRVDLVCRLLLEKKNKQDDRLHKRIVPQADRLDQEFAHDGNGEDLFKLFFV